MSEHTPADSRSKYNMSSAHSTQEYRQQAVRVIMYLGLGGGLLALAANLWMYFQAGASQMLVVVGGITGAWILLIMAYRQAKSGNLDRAGLLCLGGIMLGMGIGELVHEGLTLFLGIGGGIGILVAGAMTLPSLWWVWMLCIAMYGGYFWAVNALEPLLRYDVSEIVPFQIVIITVVVALVGLIIWQFFRVLRFGTIRARLLVTFIILVLLPALAVGTISNVLYAQRTRGQVLDHLGSVATMKQLEVQDWADNLTSNLLLAMPSADQFIFTEKVLAGPERIDANDYQHAYGRELDRFELIITRGKVFDEMFLVNPLGVIMLSTDITREGLNEYGYPYFEGGLRGPFVSPQYLSQQINRRIITVAAPITDTQGEVIGLLAGRVNLERLEQIMMLTTGLGETGEVYLVGRRDLRLLTPSRYEGYVAGEAYPLFSEGIQRGAETMNGQKTYTNYAGVLVLGAFRYLEGIDMILLVEQGQTEALEAVNQSIVYNIGVTAVVVFIAIMGALFVTTQITTPIADLAQTAEKIAGGDLDLEAAIPQEDEIGALAKSFNLMTSRLRQTLAGLEQQVDERTEALRLRSSYLQGAAEVSQAAASMLEPEQLIHQVVEVIRERFNLYYVGLFTVDEPEEWAVLRAGTGDAGKEMLARNHRIRIGTGMIGWSIANQQSRVALRAELDDARLANPLLPNTRSEAAIPLRSRGRVIGAITVQSNLPDAFDEATVSVFETMADQVGVALDNARLFTESQQAYDLLSRAYAEQTRTGWGRRLRSGQALGYRSDLSGTVVRESTWLPESSLVFEKGDVVTGHVPDGEVKSRGSTAHQGELFLGVPVKVRDQIIGVIQGYKSADSGEWRPDEIQFMKEVANIVSMTLENARLYEDTQRRAESERVIAEISTRIRESLDVDTVMQTAAIELQRVLGLKDITIRLGESNE